MIRRFSRKGPTFQMERDFWSKEFYCSCGFCMDQLVDTDLVSQLQMLRDELKQSIRIKSGYRCERHNEQLIAQGLKASKKSQHLQGKAADISVVGYSGSQLYEKAKKFFKAIGVGSGWIHVDTRPQRVVWFYDGLTADDLV